MADERKAQQAREVVKKIQEAGRILDEAVKKKGSQTDASAEQTFDQKFIVKVQESYKQKSESAESSTSSESSK